MKCERTRVCVCACVTLRHTCTGLLRTGNAVQDRDRLLERGAVVRRQRVPGSQRKALQQPVSHFRDPRVPPAGALAARARMPLQTRDRHGIAYTRVRTGVTWRLSIFQTRGADLLAPSRIVCASISPLPGPRPLTRALDHLAIVFLSDACRRLSTHLHPCAARPSNLARALQERAGDLGISMPRVRKGHPVTISNVHAGSAGKSMLPWIVCHCFKQHYVRCRTNSVTCIASGNVRCQRQRTLRGEAVSVHLSGFWLPAALPTATHLRCAARLGGASRVFKEAAPA